MFGVSESIVYEIEEAGGIAFHDKGPCGIFRAEGSVVGSNVFEQPLVGDDRRVRSAEPMPAIATDAGPGSVVIGIAGMDTGADDVEKFREGFPQPRAGIVLIADGIDPEFCHECGNLVWRTCRLQFP